MCLLQSCEYLKFKIALYLYIKIDLMCLIALLHHNQNLF